MNEIKLSVEDKNLDIVLSILNNLNAGLISEIKTTANSAVNADNRSNSAKTTFEGYSSTPKLSNINADEKRKKLFSFAFLTLILLSIAAVYFEGYDEIYVPSFLRVVLAAYWLYSLAGIIVSKRGNDYWVSKLYFNVSK